MTPMEKRNIKKVERYKAAKEGFRMEIIAAYHGGLSMVGVSKKLGVSLKMVRETLIEAGKHQPKEWS